MLNLFLASNLVIVAGYMSLALLSLPGINPVLWRSLRIRSWWTRLCGFGFFASCGMTHVEHLLHAATGVPVVFTDLHMVVIHLVQAICVVGFMTGFYVEVVRPQALRQVADPHLLSALDFTDRSAAENPPPLTYEPALLDHLALLEKQVYRLEVRARVWATRMFLVVIIAALLVLIRTQGGT